MKGVNQKCVDFIKQFEGCRLKSYKCLPTEKYYTIGYGHYGADVTPNMVITQDVADKILELDLIKYANRVNNYDHIYNWTENEFCALLSFCYNIGSINQLTANGTRTRKQIADKITAYCKSGGKIIKGLRIRREKEKALFLQKG